MSISRGSVPTLVDRGRQKKKSSAGDQELSELEKLAYPKMPKVISEGKKKKKSKVKV
jgi:hypothetical protein